MYSTVEDLYRWEQALTAGQLLGPDAWREMHMTQSPVSSSSLQRYGYGWFIIEPQQVVWHSGDLSGHHTWIFRDLGTELTIVALTNDDAWDARGIDLIVLHERSRFLQDQRIFPAVRYLGMVAGVAGLLSLLVAVAALARGRRRLSRPGPRRLVVRFLIPLAIAVPVLVVASQPVRLLGWSALTVTAPAIAWLSISLLGVVALTMAIAARAFIRPVE
jgi:hypothetical protein